MLTLAYYILKVIICSGILYGYYLMALRDKIFHKWNRFYLLAAIIISLAAPLIKINIWQKADEPKTQVVQLLQVVNTGDEFVYEYTKDKGDFQVNTSNLSLIIYIAISAFLFAFLVQTLLTINRLKKNCQQTIVEGINFIHTDAKGTPFSFFNNIFWNENIDIGTSTGKQIFKHEVAHVQEKHSHDKIFINILLIFFWINPFFWLMRRELNMIHEFIADKKALEDSDTAAFAAMILQATYPDQQFNLTNNFFYSPIKRRLLMLTKNKNPKINYLSRMLVLPLAALILFAFTLKMKTINSTDNYTGKKINVVIDAGHGGDDKGISVNNINEKDLALSIAKEINDLNKNDKINIILSREDDKTISVKDRVIFSEANKADLFVSIHVDGEENKNAHSGLSVLIPMDDNTYLKESRLLGTDILESFKTNYQLQISNDLKQPNKGVWILNANQCPAVLIETGFLTTQKDFEYLSKKKNQQIIAQNILNGIEKYAKGTAISQETNNIIKDSIPITKDTASTNNTFKNKPLLGAAFIDTKKRIWLHADTMIYTTEPNKTYINPDKAVVIVNGKKENNDILKSKSITSKKLTVHSGDEEKMLSMHGEAAKNGVFVFEDAVIIDKPPYYPNAATSKNDDKENNDKIFTKVEIEAQFAGGQEAWLKYIQPIIQKNVDLACYAEWSCSYFL